MRDWYFISDCCLQFKEKTMRLIIIYFLLLSNVIANGQTSTYHPLPESYAVWNVYYQYSCFGLGNGGSTAYDYPIVISGDTVIQNQLYKKLETPFFLGTTIGDCYSIPVDPAYQGAFRQDISNKEVYYVPQFGTEEELLFDFNMEVGDTVKGHLATYNDNHIITSIDSILVDNNYRKQWNIGASSGLRLIEGIGSTFGFFKPLPSVLSHQPFFDLTCFQENGTTLYPENTTDCLVVTDIQSVTNEKLATTAFPNPSTEAVQLNFGKTVSCLTVNVFSSLGELISSKQIKYLDSYKQILPEVQGIYLIQLIEGNGDESVLRVVKR